MTPLQGHLYCGTMSGTPNNPTVHGGPAVRFRERQNSAFMQCATRSTP
ncbi:MULTISPECIES: hypothetical protein [Sorangium]|nr:hypothetical protein [Sorangium cellulosum]